MSPLCELIILFIKNKYQENERESGAFWEKRKREIKSCNDEERERNKEKWKSHQTLYSCLFSTNG